MSRKLPKVLTEKEIESLHNYLQSSAARRSLTNVRDYCLIILMLEYGLRVQEVCDLGRADLDMITGKLHIKGKGKKDRILFLAPQHLKHFEQWLAKRPESSWLFCTIHSSRGLPGYRLDQRQVRDKVKRIGKKIGRNDLHPHLLRHTFASRLYAHTKDLVRVQEVLGHEDITTTRIYTHISGADIKDTLLDFHKE